MRGNLPQRIGVVHRGSDSRGGAYLSIFSSMFRLVYLLRIVGGWNLNLSCVHLVEFGWCFYQFLVHIGMLFFRVFAGTKSKEIRVFRGCVACFGANKNLDARVAAGVGVACTSSQSIDSQLDDDDHDHRQSHQSAVKIAILLCLCISYLVI